MSEQTNPTVYQERAEMPAWAVYAFAGAIAALLVIGFVVTWISEAGKPVVSGWRQESAAVHRVPREIQGVDQTLFSAHLPSTGSWEEKTKDLSGYRWIDRKKGTVAIPVERAMDLLVERGHVE